jgi:hypothetical protein
LLGSSGFAGISEIVKTASIYGSLFWEDRIFPAFYLKGALEAKAEFIVSYDRDLLRLKEFQSIKIVKPEEIPNELEKATNTCKYPVTVLNLTV